MLGKACCYEQRTFTRITDDVYSFSGGNHLVVIGNSIVFACHTVEAHCYLTLSVALGRNAEVHFALLAHSSLHAYGTVAFELHHLLEDEDEGNHEESTTSNSCENQERVLGDYIAETDTCPTETYKEDNEVFN